VNVKKNFFNKKNWILKIFLVNQSNCEKKSIYETYFPTFDNYGTDKNVDPSDMDSKWLYIYFDNMQLLHDYDVRKNSKFLILFF
jgi:hypothetical protein